MATGTPIYALSLRQPWATLLTHGLKTIEIRRWRTNLRCRIYIHASRTPDERPQAWAHVPKSLLADAQRGGGLVGHAEIAECRRYDSADAFVREQADHLNDPTWFEPPMYGIVFREPTSIAFVPARGQSRFFKP